jgi:RND family efflux transporter MFP subunit
VDFSNPVKAIMSRQEPHAPVAPEEDAVLSNRSPNPSKPIAEMGGPPVIRTGSSPSARAHRRRLGLAVAFCVALILFGLVWAYWNGRLGGRQSYTGTTWTVPREKLKVSIIERGTLESAKNSDIVCTVRSGTRGSTVATTIKWVIEPGTQVVKGEKVIEFDSSGFVEQLKDQKIKVDQAKANWVTASEQYRIQESQNESDLEAAKSTEELARIDLNKYEKGEYQQALEDVEGRIEVAKSDVTAWQNRSAWSARMVGLGYITRQQADVDESKLSAAEIALKKLQTEKHILISFTKGRTVQDLNAKLAEAKRAVDRVKSQSKAKLAQADADRLAKESIYTQEQARLQEVEEQIGRCTVVAPQDGLVVYYVSDQARGGGGAQQAIVAQGEPVREGQKLMQIPDLTQMLVNVRVHEAMVSSLRNHKGSSASNSGSWQPAEIRIDAVPKRIFKGQVRAVDSVAGQQDWFAADVKLYKTVVSIDERVEGLKPGMSAEVTIYAEETADEVLVVPVQAIVGTISLGAKPQLFVVGNDGQPQLRNVELGLSNQRLVEVKSGLQEGEKVVLNPAPLVDAKGDKKSEKAGSKSGDGKKDTNGDSVATGK